MLSMRIYCFGIANLGLHSLLHIVLLPWIFMVLVIRRDSMNKCIACMVVLVAGCSSHVHSTGKQHENYSITCPEKMLNNVKQLVDNYFSESWDKFLDDVDLKQGISIVEVAKEVLQKKGLLEFFCDKEYKIESYEASKKRILGGIIKALLSKYPVRFSEEEISLQDYVNAGFKETIGTSYSVMFSVENNNIGDFTGGFPLTSMKGIDNFTNLDCIFIRKNCSYDKGKFHVTKFPFFICLKKREKVIH